MKRVVVLFLVFLFPVFAWAAHDVTTLQELEQDVKNNLVPDVDPYHPDSVLDDFINLACRDLASYGVIVKADSVVVASGTAIYSLNDDFLEAIAVFPCTATASRGLDRISFANWGKIAAATQKTTTAYYAILPEYIADSSGGIIAGATLWLYPAHSGVADTLVVIYTAEATELTADADTCNIPYSYRPLVGMYATALAFARAQSYDKSAWWFALYDQTLKQKLLFKQYRFDYIIYPKEINKQ